MRNIALALLFFLAVAYCQEWTAKDLIEMKGYGMPEDKILAHVEKIKASGIALPADDETCLELQKGGFSAEFVRAFREIMQPAGKDGGAGRYKVEVSVRPPGAGKIRFEPDLDELGRAVKGSVLRITPEANHPYLFDHWEGDAQGYQPVAIAVDREVRLVAYFQKPQPVEDRPPALKDPARFKDTRRAGYKYLAEAIGKVEGQGHSKDWGITGEGYYNYLYRIQYSSEVLDNDGFSIIERRTFTRVDEVLMISKYQFHLDVRSDLKPVKELVSYLSSVVEVLPVPGAQATGKAIELVARGADMGLLALERMELSEDEVRRAFRGLKEMGVDLSDVEQNFVSRHLGRVIGYGPNMRLLEGKSFLLKYEDGVGLTEVRTEGAGEILSLREKELLDRAFYLSDYYIFKDAQDPGRAIKPGDSWKVDARNLAGTLDPKLRHRARGSITLYRDHNTARDQSEMAVFRLVGGTVHLVPPGASEKIEGEMSFSEGKILYDLGNQFVAEAEIRGTARYQSVSRDHLLFEARMSTEPALTISYRCTCEK